MIRYLTSGESHGKQLTVIIEGIPAGLEVSRAYIDRELTRRQGGYGRGGRMRIETDKAEITSGVRWGRSIGSPICLVVKNKDWENWLEVMAAGVPHAVEGGREVTRPRPGHADLAGGLKYGERDLRNILERSSARETCVRVAAGAIAKRLLSEFGINVMSWVVEIGGARLSEGAARPESLFKKAEASQVRCPGSAAAQKMKKKIDEAKKNGDSVGGVFKVVATGVPPGLGSHVHWDRKLDGRLAAALMSVQAIKGVEVGVGFKAGSLPGSRVHDAIYYGDGSAQSRQDEKGSAFWPQKPRFYRKTNNAGGIEGGTTNGEPVVVSAAMKPIPTLYKPLNSVDINSKEPFKASVERSDVCAVPAAAVVGEAVVAFELAAAFLEKFGGDSMPEVERSYRAYLRQIAGY